jgi:cytochrome c-type biogenesis protein CcmE
VLYLLFAWTGIPSIIGLIEGIIYLTSSNARFAEMVVSRSGGISLKLLALGAVGSLLTCAVVVAVVVVTFQSTIQRSDTVKDLQTKGGGAVGKNMRVSGVVLGGTIKFDEQALTLSFAMANDPSQTGNTNSNSNNLGVAQVQVVYSGPKPTLLKDGSRVTVTGKLGKDGIFYADELLVDWHNP